MTDGGEKNELGSIPDASRNTSLLSVVTKKMLCGHK